MAEGAGGQQNTGKVEWGAEEKRVSLVTSAQSSSAVLSSSAKALGKERSCGLPVILKKNVFFSFSLLT